MLGEYLVSTCLFLGGWTYLNVLGLRGWITFPLGFLAGLLLLVNMGFLQVVLGLSTAPIWTLSGVIGFSLALFSLSWSKITIEKRAVINLAFCVLFLWLLIFVFRNVPLVTYHIDSFRYILTSILLADNNYDLASFNLLTKRLLAVPFLHAPANIFNEKYLPSITPLMSISFTISLCWFFVVGNCESFHKRFIQFLCIAIIFLLCTNNRYVFHSMYINGHLYFAVCLTTISVCSWLLANSRVQLKRVFIGLMFISRPALVVTR